MPVPPPLAAPTQPPASTPASTPAPIVVPEPRVPVVAATRTLVPRVGLVVGLVYVAVAQCVEAAAFVVWSVRDRDTAQPLIDASVTIVRVAVPVALVAVASLLTWTFLVVRTARRSGLTSATPLLASICWLVPIVNLFVPWRQLQAVSRHVRAAAPVSEWWVFSLAGVVANRVVGALVEGAVDDLGSTLARVAVVSSISALCFVVAVVAGVRSVTAIHRASRSRAERHR